MAEYLKLLSMGNGLSYWIFIPPATKLGGGGEGYIGFTLSVCPSVRLSVCLLTFRVRPVASTIQDGFFPYLVQMINSMRGCVACDDLWPWPISSRSFGHGFENRVRSVASTVPDGFFPYLAQMITSMRKCVACDDLCPWPISSRSFDLVLIWDPTWFNSVGNHEAAGGILRTQVF